VLTSIYSEELKDFVEKTFYCPNADSNYGNAFGLDRRYRVSRIKQNQLSFLLVTTEHMNRIK